MKNMKPVYLIATGFMTLLALGCVSCGQNEKQRKAMEEQAAQAKAESQVKQRAEAEEAEKERETALVRDAISKNTDFAICETCWFLSHRVAPVAPLYEEWSSCEGWRCVPCLRALAAGGFADIDVHRDASGQWVVWKPTPKSEQAIRQGIIKQIVPQIRDISEWHCLLGCRELQQIDATTQLSDGLKVDFSWHWKTTGIGVGYGLSGERQRGVAYFTKTASGLVIDKIKME